MLQCKRTIMQTSINDMQQGKKWLKWISRSISLYLVIIFVLLALTGGFVLGKKQGLQTMTNGNAKQTGQSYGKVLDKNSALPNYLTKDINFSLFWDVWNKIQSEYIDRPAGETNLFYGAISGLVNSLNDPYSVFLPPEPAKEFQDDLNGKFEGIGAEIGIQDELLTIISPLSDSPAEKAGLRPKDRVIEIDGVSTQKMNVNEAVSRIRGDKGTTVILKIFRDSDNNFHTISIVRDTIHIKSVKWEMKDNVAVIKITNFNSDTDALFQKAVNDILLKKPQGIVLDLRSNPGGYLDRAITIASYWLPTGKVVVQEEFAGKAPEKYLANGQAQFKNYPTVVLVNQGSASASEIVAGALRDNQVAKLVGEKTYGKGSVQNLEELSDGSALKLTIARWLTPSGSQINVVGIEPDVKVELTEADINAGKDPQLDKALELLSSQQSKNN